MENTIDINELYEDLDPLVVKSLDRLCYYYKNTHPEDFADLRQQVRVDMWKSLPKLLSIATDEQSLTRIIVNAISFSFKVNYKKVKKHNDIEKLCLDNDILLTINPSEKDELVMSLSEYPARVWEETKRINRFKDREGDVVSYCVALLMTGRLPSKKLISTFFNVSNAQFYINYSKVILSLACERIKP